MMKRGFRSRGAVLALFACSIGVPCLMAAQDAGQQNSPPATSQSPAKGADDTDSANQQQKSSSDSSGANKQSNPKSAQNDRIFFALPNYLTVENHASLPPLTTGQKFKTVAQGCFDPVEFAFIAVQAGIDQADNANPTYHQGFSGYAKRFGTDYADAVIGNFGTGAIFPTLLHQDPRYYQMGKGSFLRRFSYAGARVLVTRSEKSGNLQFNFSEFLGNGMAAGLSNIYHPGPHTIASTADVLSTQIILDAAGYELKEFWPDIRRFLLRAKHKN